ncbi:MAG TPA: sensor domain-containing diguanylate cyclase [Herbaspirillum sp.]|jgi:diguanylate cyclase (GGDEF)-like protein/PAS domain S-box-containing protein
MPAQDNTPNEIDSAVYKTLLESTNAIPWRIDWKTMQFTYIGPQIEGVLGWSAASWVSAQDWASRIHEEERERIVNFCVAQSQAGTDHEADYRALTKDGRYVWIRDVVHVTRNAAGEVEALIGFMFDIDERKRNEAKLEALQKELEELSFKDGLTGVANRRRFDAMAAVEWNNALRQGVPLSLVMIDIDYFKQYNDHYGHIEGDACLRKVAQVLSAALYRPRDFVARFGGEEFVLVLPEADEAAASMVAQRCRQMLSDAAIAHAASAIGPSVTFSMGIGSIVPVHGDDMSGFLSEVDRRLYLAKQRGRNCIAGSA